MYETTTTLVVMAVRGASEGKEQRKPKKKREKTRMGVEERGGGKDDEGRGRDFAVGRSSAVKAAAKGLRARSRGLLFLKITGTGELTAGQLPGRKSLRKFLLPQDRGGSFVNSFVISSVELVPLPPAPPAAVASPRESEKGEEKARAEIMRPTEKVFNKDFSSGIAISSSLVSSMAPSLNPIP